VNTRRFNWIALLVGALVFATVGLIGLLAGGGTETTVFFALGASCLIGAIRLYRQRLP
jgi:predicted phage tail protein